MTFLVFRNLWRSAFRQTCTREFQRVFYRRSVSGRAMRRFRLFVKSSAFYSAFRYGLRTSSPLSLSAVIFNTDDAPSEEHQSTKNKGSDGDHGSECGEVENWEKIYQDDNIKVQRRCRTDYGGIYEYRCTGTYNDITPINFVETQNDVDYRRKWDENVISLEVLEENEAADVQVISWVARYPYPMYAREYIYICRKFVDDVNQTIVIENRAIDPCEYASTSKYVRVTCYKSCLVVRAHTTLNEKGLDYTLTYYDDPKSSIPTMAYNWIVNQGGPYFMKKIYQAALERERTIDPESDWESNCLKHQHFSATNAERTNSAREGL